MKFKLKSKFAPMGHQPQAIQKLAAGVEQGKNHQVLLGVTGSGKTFTMANVIEQTQRPALILAHNKTLAAQLYQEFRDFFPDNAVSYFVSYYDYYQPEAYIPSSDTYIEKDSSINDEIDKLRLASTANLMTRNDVIIVASVSCIYNLGSPVEYGRYILQLVEGELISRETLLLQLANLQYERSEADLMRGTYRLRGDVLQVWPAYEDRALRIDTLENKITSIDWIDPIGGQILPKPNDDEGRSPRYIIYPAKHYVVNPQTKQDSVKAIKQDLETRIKQLHDAGRQLEAFRLQQKVTYDLDMIENLGFVNGIENYSRYFDGREPGDPPFTLMDYFAENARLFDHKGFLTFVDESHMTLPQVRGMYNGDQARKGTLIEYGFRLPSALDNRPLQFEEFLQRNDQMIHVSATPKDWELSHANHEVVEQLVRPTGLVDPEVELRKIENQIEDLVIEVLLRKTKGQRALVTTLTKKMAEALTTYLNTPEKIFKLVRSFDAKRKQKRAAEDNGEQAEQTIMANQQLPIDSMEIGPINALYLTTAEIPNELTIKELTDNLPKVAYLHSDIDTLERSDILADLRRGVYDVVVGINLLREGLDLPEVSLVAILDADKEGFLRSETSMVQTIGRAARHVHGHAILYADRLTKSMKAAISETNRRREIQLQYNKEHGITPAGIQKEIRERMIEKTDEDENKGRGRKGRSGKKTAKLETVINLNKSEQIILEDLQPNDMTPFDRKNMVKKLRRRMKQAANEMDYELAAAIRDKIGELEA
jgi:excinuclease ABC subunit B